VSVKAIIKYRLFGTGTLDVGDDLNTHCESRDNGENGILSPGVWFAIAGNFQPRMTISKEIFLYFCDRRNTSRPLDTFEKMFPCSLFMRISYYNNGKLTIFETIYNSHATLVKFFNFTGLA